MARCVDDEVDDEVDDRVDDRVDATSATTGGEANASSVAGVWSVASGSLQNL